MSERQEERRRLQRNRRSTKRGYWWLRVYRARMARGLEKCRNRRCSRPASTFGHLIPHAYGGAFNLDNLTLLCYQCNEEQADEIWPWLRPLRSEPEHDAKMEEARAWLPVSVSSEAGADPRFEFRPPTCGVD